ncbi:YrpD family protein [Paenibacillus ehimensis]|uniref:YrpD family protein n=1 Tax=Paenibacillus ehimensis TaxID=79264 RepID=UPI0004724409|nr:YrpD family protein [Paenibacillus ehimensis]MEC0211299.1 YrpD family protein [Paenibacillus ehimensis]
MKKKFVLLAVAAAVMTVFPTAISASDATGRATSGGESASIEMSGAEVTDFTKTATAAKIDEVLAKARQAGRESVQAQGLQRSTAAAEHTVDYTLIDGNTAYFYEKSPVQAKEKVYVYEVAASEAGSDAGQRMLAGNLPGGIGGRAVVNTNGSYLNTTVRLATPSQLTGAPSGATYTYAGFTGTSGSQAVETDMGLQYSNAYNNHKWLPVMAVFKGSKTYGTFVSPYNQVQYKNGYKPGSDVNLTAYRNLNGSVRLSMSGYAICSDMTCSSQADTYLTSVLEVANVNVSSVTRWKMLATIAGSESVTGRSYAQFKNVNVDGTARNPVKDVEDYATVDVSGNSATITVTR